MVAPWVMDEMKTADLKDKRLDKRLREVLSQLWEHPAASIPAACGGHAEMTAAYRFFDNEKATFGPTLAPHAEATRQRVAQQAVVVLAQDTTEVDVTRPEQQVTGAGPLDGGSRWGAFLHPLHAFTPDGTPLGTLHAEAWVRDQEAVTCASMSRSRSGSMTSSRGRMPSGSPLRSSPPNARSAPAPCGPNIRHGKRTMPAGSCRSTRSSRMR